MKPRLSALLAGLVAAAIGTGIPTTAKAVTSESLRIVDLRVSGGEQTWHAINDFRLDWSRAAGAAPASAVHYLIRDEAEGVLAETEIAGEIDEIEHIHIPAGPGVYRAEVWLEGRSGETGPPAMATLRYDNVAPGPARPLGPSGWIAADSPALLRIGHPASPLPISGIRGYAISVDTGEESAPCQSPTRCTLDETDLSGGADDDTIALTDLPEGSSSARVVAVSGSGMRSKTVGSATLRVDATFPEVRLQGSPPAWSDHPVQLLATASDALSGMAAAGPGGPYTAIAVDAGAPTTAPGDSVSMTVRGEGVRRVSYYARDAAGNVADGEAGAPSPAHAVIRIDEAPPRVAFAREQDPTEPERIEATVTDPLSGPSATRGTISIRPAGSRQPFEPLPTAVPEGKLIARWDSDRYPAGTYQFRAVGYDSAGNASASELRLGGARMVLANPLKVPVEIVSGFGGGRLLWQRCSRRDGTRRCHHQTIEDPERRPPARRVPYGHGTAFSGRLSSVSGLALGGLPVVVTETFAPGADPADRETVARTRPDGTFQVRLAPGPTRRVRASFGGTRTLTDASGPPARFAVLSSLRLRSSAATARVGGAPLVFSGRVGDLGAPIPPAGLAVQLQFRLPGADWSEFRTVQTDASGRFRYPYAFSDDDSRGVRFQFRAHLPVQRGWPYEPAVSRPVFVAGR